SRIPGNDIDRFSEEERTHRAYINWTPTKSSALSASYLYDRYTTDRTRNVAVTRLRNHEVTMQAAYFAESGIRAKLRGTFIDQEANRFAVTGEDRFFTIDAQVGYALPKRLGFAQITVKNLFDRSFTFQDRNFQTNEPRDLRFTPEREIRIEFSTQF
ncbi:MAG: hypothetical protein ACR2RL_16700, partial [Gammaproteobacteria bacterium]